MVNFQHLLMRATRKTISLLPEMAALVILEQARLWLSENEYRSLRRGWYRSNYQNQVLHIGGLEYQLHQNEVVSEAFFVNPAYNQAVFMSLKSLAQQCKSFIDIGANIGLISTQISHATRLPTLSIEPVPSNYRLLQKNISQNQLDGRVQTEQAAAGAELGEITIYLSEDNFGDHRIGQFQDEHRQAIQVPMLTLDSYLKDTPTIQAPYLIKIDVQGYEPYVLQGATQTLKAPCCIVMELWESGLKTANSSVAELENIRQDLNLQAYEIEFDGKLKLRPLNRLQDASERLEDKWDAHTDIVLTNMDLALYVN